MSQAPQADYRQTFRRLLGYTKQYKAAVAVAMLGMIGYATIDVLFISQIETFVDDGLTNRDRTVFQMAPFFIIGVFILRGFL